MNLNSDLKKELWLDLMKASKVAHIQSNLLFARTKAILHQQ